MMAGAAAAVEHGDSLAGEAKKGGKKKLLLIAVPVVLLALGAGLWFSGILPGMLGLNKAAKAAAAGGSSAVGEAPHVPVFAELPEMVSNLNVSGRRPVYVKLKVRVELARAEDQAVFTADQPRMLDLFQTYLREMRPEELRGSEGTYRLREELIARANIAMAPAHIIDILFSEMLVQ